MTKSINKDTDLLKRLAQLQAELSSVYRSNEARAAQLYNIEERFALAMRSASDGLWDWNLETNEVYYSARWKSMLGYDESELEDSLTTWKTLVHHKEIDTVLGKVEDYLSGRVESFEVEMRMYHKNGHHVFVRSRAFKVMHESTGAPIRLIGTHVDITASKKAEQFDKRQTKIIEMIAKGEPVSQIYDEIAFLYEDRHPGLRCSMLELEGNLLLHGAAPSLPKEYSEAVHGLVNGPNVGSCGASTYFGKRVLVENIETDDRWAELKDVVLPYGIRCCWSEPIKSSSGQILGAFGMYFDYPALPNKEQSKDLVSASRLTGIVMEREINQRRIRNLAYKDKLTGLSSRAHFYINVEELIKVSTNKNQKFSLLYIDLDNFKNVNDSLGHDIGDLLLKEVALRLSSACRKVDYIARLSGDEFCIVIRDINDDYSVEYIVKRCLDLVSRPVEFVGSKFIPTCSVGIAHFPKHGNDLQTLLKTADTALYSAKDLGKNCYAFYQEEMTLMAEYRFKFEQYLRESIENQTLSIVYQPKIDMNTGLIEGVEALSRWYHPQLGSVSPAEFIRIAEQTGLIKPLTEWVLKTACLQLKQWTNSGFGPIRMAVNISPTHFLDSDFVHIIKCIIDETDIAPSELELEVTEDVVQTNIENLGAFERIKELGVKLSIDDFGTGYSSLASLKHFSVDFLKIDKYFVDEMLTDNKSCILIKSMIELGHSLGYKITAEGIEKLEQIKMLQELGCDSVQGDLYSKPVSPHDISTLLTKNKLYQLK